MFVSCTFRKWKSKFRSLILIFSKKKQKQQWKRRWRWRKEANQLLSSWPLILKATSTPSLLVPPFFLCISCLVTQKIFIESKRVPRFHCYVIITIQNTQEYKMLFFLQFSQQLKNELDINFILVLWEENYK